jgi:hypothetical protein
VTEAVIYLFMIDTSSIHTGDNKSPQDIEVVMGVQAAANVGGGGELCASNPC